MKKQQFYLFGLHNSTLYMKRNVRDKAHYFDIQFDVFTFIKIVFREWSA